MVRLEEKFQKHWLCNSISIKI